MYQNSEHPLNMLAILVVCDVSKDRTSIDVSAEHLQNMYDISCTFNVLNEETFNFCTLRQSWNIPLILVAADVSKF